MIKIFETVQFAKLTNFQNFTILKISQFEKLIYFGYSKISKEWKNGFNNKNI